VALAKGEATGREVKAMGRRGFVAGGARAATALRPSLRVCLAVCCCAGLAPARAEEGGGPAVRVGLGGYATVLPRGAKGPPATIYRTDKVSGPMPTNGWWSSLAWQPFSERHYPHPLAVQTSPAGPRVYYPGAAVTANRAGVFGMSPEKGGDLVLGHSAQPAFPEARVDGFSDWFVSVRFAQGKHRLRVSYGHGSPFVYALYEGGDPQLTFPRPPVVWSGTDRGPVLGVSVGGRHYALFGASGSRWSGLGTKRLTNHSGGKAHFSLALLPEKGGEALALFSRFAYAHVVASTTSWSYEEAASTVTTRFEVKTRAYEGKEEGALFALYPHQWRYLAGNKLLPHGYDSVRGRLKLVAGPSFTTRLTYPGVLPALPLAGTVDRALLNRYLDQEAGGKAPPLRDTYWEGKFLGKLATLTPLAEQAGNLRAANALRATLRGRLESWLAGGGKSGGLFYYDKTWGALIGHPASYGSDTELNDHHFHYGYFLKAAAEVARHDKAWAADARWGGMVKLLARDIASPSRSDPLFPFLRNFDPYAGHSWASGHARFADGNNNESSSEAMNAWCGLILWGEATGNRALRDLGVFLYTTEMTAIHEYWFDVHGENHPKTYPASVVTMVWGGKGANATWFSDKPELVHGINWLPIHAGSLYLGLYPDYARKNYDALVREKKGTRWDEWADIILMYRALSDPADALRQFDATRDTYKGEGGNSKANTYAWLHALNELGQVERTVRADFPLRAVFRKGKQRTYIVYNPSDARRTVTFSDGAEVVAAGKGLFSTRRALAPPR
jgi:endoglucanase Acf2